MPPLYVSYIFSDHMRLIGDTSKLQEVISKSKYGDRVFHDEYGLNIRFILSKPIFDKNDSLELLKWHNSCNILFSIDKGWGPSEIMQAFQERGFLKDSFEEIAWKGPGDWFTTKRNPIKK